MLCCRELCNALLFACFLSDELSLLDNSTITVGNFCPIAMVAEGFLLGGDGWPDEPELPGTFGPPVPVYSIILTLLWPLPVLLYWLLDFLLTRRRLTVQDTYTNESGSQIAATGSGSEMPREQNLPGLTTVHDPPGYFPIMMASLEHSLPHLATGRATAGGLGKVVDLIVRKHPSDILLVHPMLAEVEGKLEYGNPIDEQPSLRLVVDGQRHDIRVFRFASPPREEQCQQVRVEFLMPLVRSSSGLHVVLSLEAKPRLSHEIFEARTLDGTWDWQTETERVCCFELA